MSGLRRKAIVVAGALAAGVAAWGAPGTAADNRHEDRWWNPPGDVRRMLDQVDARSLERYDRALVGFGTRHTLSTQDDPHRGIGAARDYIKRQFDQIAATSGGRMTVELQSYVQPPASRIPTADDDHQRRRHAARDRSDVRRPRLRRRRALRLARHRRARTRTSDAPGANDDGSGTSAVHRARPRHGAASDRGDDRLRRVRRRGAGPVRLQPLRRARPGSGLEHPGRAEHGHHRQPGRRQRRPRPAHDPAVLRGRADERDAAADRPAAVDRRRERRHLAPARALRQGDRREQRHRHARQARLAARPLPARRRPDPVPAARLAGRALQRAVRELRPPAPGRARRERHAVRRPARVRRLPLPRARDPRRRARRWPRSRVRRARRPTHA